MNCVEKNKPMDNKKKYTSLDDIFTDADFHTIADPQQSHGTSSRTEEERLIDSFQKIVDFYEKNQREPTQGGGVDEHSLFARLKSLKSDAKKIEILRGYDKYNLLNPTEKKAPETLDDIFQDDELDLITDDTEGLFDFKHVKKSEERAATDFVAKRKPCKDFEKYAPLFKAVQKDLRENQRKLVKFELQNLREGVFYVNNGLLFLLEKIDITRKEHYRDDGTRVREDGRTRCIFENGTESNMLYRSVQKLLYDNGQVVSETDNAVAETLSKNFNNITEADKTTGFIYVLKSKSDNSDIKAIENLYKIGYSTTPVEERIKNANKEPTYLMADVSIIATYKCYNLNLQKFEQLIHQFFGKVRLNLDVINTKGQQFAPREWFIVPFNVIDKTIELIKSGDILDYAYDEENEEIMRK
jgi:T5orf172 domain